MLRLLRLPLALLLTFPARAPAQAPQLLRLRPAPESAPLPVQLPAIPETIAPIDIPLRSGSAAARLSEIEALLRPAQELLEVERSAGGALDSVTRLSNSQLLLPSYQMTRRALLDLGREWDKWRVQVQAWTRLLRERTGALDSSRHELSEGAQLWQRTVQRARAEAAQADVIAEAEQVLQKIRDHDSAVLRRLTELVAVELTLTRARLMIDAGNNTVAEAMARERQKMFRIDSPTFWTHITGKLPSLGETVREHWGLAASAMRAFASESQARIVVHLLATVLLVMTILALRRGVGWPDGVMARQISPDERWLFTHPASSSLLVALLATAIYYPRAPVAVYDVALMAAALLLLRVVPSLLPADLQRFGRRATLLFIADRLVLMLLHTSPWHRIGSLAVALAGMVLLAMGIRRFHLLDDATRQRPVPRWIYRGVLVGSILVGGAVLANLTGNTSLALVVTTGLATMAYLGVLLYAVTNVVDGVVSLGVRVTANDLKFVARHGPAIVTRATQAAHLAAFVAWLGLALFLFEVWDPASAMLTQFLGAKWSIGEARVSLAGILLFFVTIWIGTVVGRWIAIVLEADILDRLHLPRGVPATVASILRYTLTAIAFFVALAAVGVDVSQLAIIGGALSVGIGFGLQTIVNNFISGLILAFERPLAIGDVIQIGTLEGEVRQIGIRASVIRTFQGAEVIVPNGQLVSNEVINWTRSDRTRRLEISVGVAYGSDPAAVISLLTSVAAGEERVRVHPAPQCLFQGFGESSLDFVLRVWTDAEDFHVVWSNVRMAVLGALNAAGIEIPFPQRDIHVRSEPGLPGPRATDEAESARTL